LALQIGRIRVTAPPPRDPDRAPRGRLALWALFAALLLLGIYFYFRYSRGITPLLGLVT
jgi:hypothetical protein